MERILLALTDGKSSPALGSAWRITAKKTDFYLDPVAHSEAYHLSAHGPNDTYEDHRFHFKVDRAFAKEYRRDGNLFLHAVPRKGISFDGRPVSDKTWLVARIRWMWQLQRPKFRSVAATSLGEHASELRQGEKGVRLGTRLEPNSVWDIDVLVSYDRPYWPTYPFLRGEVPEDAKLGPVRNDAGLWLTAVSAHRHESVSPTPEKFALPVPVGSDRPNLMSCGGYVPSDGFCWFVETVTTRDLIEANLGR